MGVYDKFSVKVALKTTKQIVAAQKLKDDDKPITKQQQMLLGDRTSYSISCTDFKGNIVTLLTEDEVVNQFVANMLLTKGKNNIVIHCEGINIVTYRPKMISWKDVGLTQKQAMEMFAKKQIKKSLKEYETRDGEIRKYVDYLVTQTKWLFDRSNHRSIMIMKKIKYRLTKALKDINTEEQA